MPNSVQKAKIITFYNAVPMPHSVFLQSKLEQEGLRVFFWYYRNLTKMYPWSVLKSDSPYFVFTNKFSEFRLLISHVLKSDLVVITGWHTKMHIFLLFFCKMLRIKTAYWLDVPVKPAKKGVSFYIKRALLKSPNYLFITGETGIKKYREWYDLKAEFHDFPYLSHAFDQAEVARVNAERQTAINRGEKIKLFISNRFIERKGYQVVFKAFEMLHENKLLERYDIHIAGIGEEFEKYSKQFSKLNPDIRFLGWVAYEEYLNQMLTADVFLHASLHEPFGIPPCDAMNCGKLVVASNAVYSSLDRITNGINGYIYDAENPAALAKILEDVALNPAVIYSLGNNARTTARKFDYTYNTKLIQVILSLKSWKRTEKN